MMRLLAGRTAKTVSVRLFYRLVGFSTPTAKPNFFDNSKVHIVSFLRYSAAPISPAAGTSELNVGVTLLYIFFRSENSLAPKRFHPTKRNGGR